MNPLDHVRKSIEARRAGEAEKNATGALDWPDYCRRKGIIQGLDAALKDIQETKQQLQRTGDLDSEE